MHHTGEQTHSPNVASESPLYVFEGPDGVGKTSLSSILQAHLASVGRRSTLFSFPGQEPGTLGAHIYKLYHDPESFGVSEISVASEQLLCTAAHADVIENRILPALASKAEVILDRYWWSTWVYASADGLEPRFRDRLIELELSLWRGIKPACIFLLRRGGSLKSKHRTDYWERLASLYQTLAIQQKPLVKVVVIENEGTLEEAFAQVLDAIA
jgi:dTMP kinase